MSAEEMSDMEGAFTVSAKGFSQLFHSSHHPDSAEP